MRFHPAACALVLSLSFAATTTTTTTGGGGAASAFAFSPPSAVVRRRGASTAAAPSFANVARRSAFGLPDALPSSSPSSISSFSTTTSSTTSLSLASGGGPEALRDYVATLSNSPASSRLSAIVKNPKLAKLAGAAALPLSYLAGAAMTPSRRLAVRAVGGMIAAATAGGVGRSAAEEGARRSCPAAVASKLLELGVDGPGARDAIAGLGDDHGVDGEDFDDVRSSVYAVYLAGMAREPMAKTSELKELRSLRAALGLDNMQVGRAHADAASSFYRDVTRFTSSDELEDEGHPDRVSLDKLLFLTERALRMGGETDEAFTFEYSRVSRALGGLSIGEGLERAKGVAKPFYERALASARAKIGGGSVDSDMLTRARTTLGIDDVEAREMHIDAFAREVRVRLGLPEEEEDDGDSDPSSSFDANQNKRVDTDAEVKRKLEAMKAAAEEGKVAAEETSHVKFAEGAHQALGALQSVFGLSDEDADYEISAATVDYWRRTALSTLEDAIAKTKAPAKAWEVIQTRQRELYLKDSAMREMMTSMIMQALGRPLEKVNGFARVNNAAATYAGLVDAIAAKETCKDVLKSAGWVEFEDFEKRCFNPDDKSSACGFLTNQDRHNMYQMFFIRSVKTDTEGSGTKSISEESRGLLRELRGMLGLSEEEGVAQIRSYFGPELQSVLTMATEEILRGNATEQLLKNLKERIDKTISDFRLDGEMVQSYAGPLYSRAVDQIGSNAPGGIPSREEVETLASLRALLGIAVEDTYAVHGITFGSAYKRAIKEALGTTGVIREEFRGPLDELRSRLGMSDAAAEEIYSEAIGERMQPMVEYISNEMERLVLTSDQLAQKRGQDFGEDYFKDGSKASVSVSLG
jgi:hypothetical protein